MFHGSSGDGYQHLQISGWREKAISEGFIAVFPTALRYCKQNYPCAHGGQAGWTTKWHNYHLPEDDDFDFDVRLPGYVAEAWPADDVMFTRMMIADLRIEANGLGVDAERLYASGFSSGAGLAARLTVEVSDLFAAVGYTGGGLGVMDHVFQLALLEGLEHKYPNGCHSKNPHGFMAADLIWVKAVPSTRQI